MEILTARFTVTSAAELPIEPATGDDFSWVSGVHMRKQYTAGIVGTGVLVFLHSGTESQRGYVAVERVTGKTDDGRSGSFTVHHGAVNSPVTDSVFGYIIPGTGTGDFTDLAGAAIITHDDEGAVVSFELT